MILHYLTTAMRQLMKYKTQNLIAIIGMGLALLCFSVCLHVSRYMNDVNESIENRDRIVRIKVKSVEKGHVWSVTTGQLAEELRGKGLQSVDFCSVEGKELREYNVVFSEDRQLPYKISVIETDSFFYKFFQPEILYGSWATTSRTPNAVVLTLSKAQQIFGNPAEAVGKHLISTHRFQGSPSSTHIAGGIPYTITAVMKDFPTNTTVCFMRPFDSLVLNDSEGIITNSFPMAGTSTYAMVDPEMTVSDFISQLERQQIVVKQLNDDCTVLPVPFEKDLSFNKGFQIISISVTIAGTLVLLAGLLNFFYFLVGSFLIRIREYNIRRAHGAGFGSLQLMLFVQSALYVALVGVVTILCMQWLIRGWHLDLTISYISFQMDVLLQQTVSYLLALLLVCTVVAFILISKVRRISISVGLFGALGGTSKHRLRSTMMGVQMVIAWIFFSLTVALYMQSQHITDTLFASLSMEEKERTLSVSLDYSFLKFSQKEELVGRLQRLSGVEQAIRARDNIVGSGWWQTSFFKGERTRENAVSVKFMRVDPAFYDFFHIPLVSGTLSREEGQLMIDPLLAQLLGEGALGMQLYDYDQKPFTVTGVCESPLISAYHNSSEEELGTIYWIYDFKGQFNHCYVKAVPGRVDEVKQSVEGLLREVLPENLQPEVSTFTETIHQAQSLEYTLRSIILFMAVVAMIISILGIYSAITLDTERRQKEMAIRKVNGAKMHQIVLLFARLYIRLLVVTAVIALPIVALLLHVCSQVYVSVVTFGFLYYAGVFLSVAALVVLAVFVRIRNIARINPSEYIKNE